MRAKSATVNELENNGQVNLPGDRCQRHLPAYSATIYTKRAAVTAQPDGASSKPDSLGFHASFSFSTAMKQFCTFNSSGPSGSTTEMEHQDSSERHLAAPERQHSMKHVRQRFLNWLQSFLFEMNRWTDQSDDTTATSWTLRTAIQCQSTVNGYIWVKLTDD